MVLHDLLTFGVKSYAFFGISVCRSCYTAIHDISHNPINDARKLFAELRQGITGEGASTTHGRVAAVANQVHDWLRNTWLPVNTMVNARSPGARVCCYIPVARWVWSECELVVGAVAYRTFICVFDEVMTTVDTPRTNGDLKHCQRCLLLSCCRLKAARNGQWDEARVFEGGLRQHLAIQYAEHEIYWAEIAQVHSGNAVFTLVSMDATKPVYTPTTVLRTEFNPRRGGLSWLINSVIVHDEHLDNCGRLALYLGRGKDGVNDNISLLDKILAEMHLKGTLKRSLHLQLDGSSSLRNKYMIAYLVYRVKCGWFNDALVRFSIADHGGDRNDAMTSHFRVGARREMIWSLATVLERMPRWYPGRAPKIHLFGDYAPIEGEELPTFLAQHFQPLLCDWKAFLDPFMHNISGYVQNDTGASEKSLHVWSIDANGQFKARRLASQVVGDAGGWSDSIDVLHSTPEPGAVPERLFFHDSRNNLIGKTKLAYIDIAQGVLDKFGSSMPDRDREWWGNFRDSMSHTKQPVPQVVQKAPTTRRHHRDVEMDDKPIIKQGIRREKKIGTPSVGDSDDDHDDSGAVDDAMDGDDPEYRVESIVGRKTGEDGDILYCVRWAKPYNDETWEPLSNLANAMRLVDEFERVRSGAKSGLSASGLAHADLARELWAQAEREAKASMVACKFCQGMFKKKGVKTHERYCPHKPKE